jgi:hypothetical protein
MKVRKLITMAMFLVPHQVAAQVDLDQLSNCPALESAYADLGQNLRSACRSPHSALEIAVAKSLVRYSLQEMCLLRDPVTSSLSRFSCFRFAQNNSGTIVGRELLCFHRVDRSSIADYTRRYDERYEEPAIAYQRGAAACSLSNGDLAATESYFPYLAGGVSRPRFGFVLALGKGSKTSDRAYHGFAELDPQVVSDSDVEILSIYRATAAWSASKSSLVGEVLKRNEALIVTEEVDKDFQQAMRSQFAPLGVGVDAIHHSFSVDYLNKRGFNITRANDLLEEWSHDVENYLEDHEFRALSNREARRMGIDFQAVVKGYTDQLPFLVRAEIAERTEPVDVYITSDGAECMSYGDGFALAMIQKTRPTETLRTSDLAISVMLVGRCRGRANAFSATKAISVARNAVLAEVIEMSP